MASRLVPYGETFGTGVLGNPPRFQTQVYLLRGHLLGHMTLRTGHVVVADPFLLDDAKPLRRKLPIGKYPVYAGTAEIDCGHDFTGLYLELAPTKPARWVPALPRGRGVAVDSASLVIADAASAKALKPLASKPDAFTGALRAALLAHRRIIVGAGCRLGSDGSYPAYFGLDARGAPVCLCVPARRYERWNHLALPDLANVDACLRWVRAVPGADGDMIFPGRTPPETLAALERFAGRRAPADVRAFYRECRPWEGDGRAHWETMAARAGFGRGGGAFPLVVREDGADALVGANGRDAVHRIEADGSSRHQSLDLASWLVMRTFVVYDLASSVRP